MPRPFGFIAACAPLLLLLLLPSAHAGRKIPTLPPGDYQTLQGPIEVLTNSGTSQVLLDLGKRGKRPLFFKNGPPRDVVVTGSEVRVYLDNSTDMKANPLPVQYVELLKPPSTVVAMYPMPKKLAVPGSQPVVRFTSITILVRICGQEPVITANELRSLWGTANSSAAVTLKEYFGSCSHNKVRFEAEDNVVVGPINVPCSGLTPYGTPFNSSFCGGDEVYGWAGVAEAAAARLGYNISRYRHRLLILPQMSACSWRGQAEVGCGERCYAWVKGQSARNLSTVFHELSHNLAAEHANIPSQVEYGDVTDPTGSCCTVRCLNAPHSWQLGWAEPLAEMDAGGLPIGLWRHFQLPAAIRNDTNLLRVRATWLPGADDSSDASADGSSPTVTSLFVSYRTAEGYDFGLDPQSAAKVSVHLFNGTRYGTNNARSQLYARLATGESWSGALQLRVLVEGISAAAANVSLCRADGGGVEVDCDDGLDNDCNGLTDEEDPSCQVAALPEDLCNDNGVCEPARGETAAACPQDCPPVCGDGFCETRRGNESAASCPADCPARCGDGYCDAARGETYLKCSVDCPADTCGDGICGSTETPISCWQDCCSAAARPTCGNGVCDAFAGEDCVTCPRDCRGKPGSGYCCGRAGTCDAKCGKSSRSSCRTSCLL